MSMPEHFYSGPWNNLAMKDYAEAYALKYGVELLQIVDEQASEITIAAVESMKKQDELTALRAAARELWSCMLAHELTGEALEDHRERQARAELALAALLDGQPQVPKEE